MAAHGTILELIAGSRVFGHISPKIAVSLALHQVRSINCVGLPSEKGSLLNMVQSGHRTVLGAATIDSAFGKMLLFFRIEAVVGAVAQLRSFVHVRRCIRQIQLLKGSR